MPKSLTSAKGDIIYASAPSIPARLGIGSNGQFLSVADSIPKWVNIPLAGFADVLKGIKGRTQVEWNALNAGEYGSNSTYNGATLPPVILENNSGFWNSASGKSLDISFHFAKKERITTLQVKCPPYSGVNPTMTVYYAQNGDTGLTLYKEIATISTADRKAYEFNEEGISADYWVVRFTSSGWIDLRLCSPSGLFTTGLYTEECHQQIMDRFNGYQPVGNYALKNEIIAKSLITTKGDIIYASAANTPARLGIGSAGQFLSIANGIPTWVNNPNTDTKNTAGSTNNTEKLYLVGAKTQDNNPQTYSNNKVYVQDNKLYSNNEAVVTSSNLNNYLPLSGGKSHQLTAPVYIAHNDISFIGTAGAFGFRAIDPSGQLPHHLGQINLSKNFGGDGNQYGIQMSAVDITNNRFNQFRVYQLGIAYQHYDIASKTATDVFTVDTAGQLDAAKIRVAKKATMQYNSTEDCIEFIFA